jgi:hypothetical protein
MERSGGRDVYGHTLTPLGIDVHSRGDRWLHVKTVGCM